MSLFLAYMRLAASCLALYVAIHALMWPYAMERAVNYGLALIAFTYIYCVGISARQDREGR